MARRSDHSREELHAMILAAAGEIVDTQGFAGLTARKVAAAIGYTVGTLYLVFRNLDDLILQLNAATLDALHAEMAAVAAGCAEPTACVRALGRCYVGFAVGHSHRFSLVFEHRLPPDTPVPAFYQMRIDRLFQLVEEAMAPLAAGRDAEAVARGARALWGGVHGICLLGLGGKLSVAGPMDPEVLTDTLVDNYLRGFAGPVSNGRAPS